jgi:hypothetical protein
MANVKIRRKTGSSAYDVVYPTADWSNIDNKPATFTPTSHTHGNITNGGTITADTAVASGQKLVLVNGSDSIVRSSIALGTGTTTFLRNDGSWATPPDVSGIPYNDVLMPTNPFGGKKLYINSIDNAMHAADKKWYVTATRHLKVYNSVTYPILNTGYRSIYTYTTANNTTFTLDQTPLPTNVVVFLNISAGGTRATQVASAPSGNTQYTYNNSTGAIVFGAARPDSTIYVYAHPDVPQYTDSPSLGSVSASQLFDGNYDSYVSVATTEYVKIRITPGNNVLTDFSSSIGYPYGQFYLSHYYDGAPEAEYLRTYNYSYAAQGIGWKQVTFSNFVNDNTNVNFISQASNESDFGRSVIEIIVVSKASKIGYLSQIDWKLSRPDLASSGSTVTKFGQNKLYNNLLFGQQTTLMELSGTNGWIRTSDNSAAAPAFSFINDTDTGMFRPAADTLAFAEGGSEVMRITSNGRVGIGATVPDQLLHVGGAINLHSQITWFNGNADINGADTNIKFRTYNGTALTEYMRLTSAGNVGIGSTSPSTKLEVAGGIIKLFESGNTALKTYSASAGGFLASYQSDAGSTFTKTLDIVSNGDGTVPSNMRFLTKADGSSNPTERLRILANGNVGIGTTSPAEALQISSGNLRLTNGSAFTTANSLVREINVASGSANQFITSSIGFRIGTFSDEGIITFGTAPNASSPTERMRIIGNGNVGIGTTAPSILGIGREFSVSAVGLGLPTAYMNVQGSRTTDTDVGALVFNNSVSGTNSVIASISSQRSGANNSGNLQFGTASAGTFTQKMTILPNGNVGIGTASPNQLFEVKGAGLTYAKVSSATNGSFRGVGFGIENDSSIYGSVAMEMTNGQMRFQTGFAGWGGFQTFFTDGTEKMRITSGGNVGIGTSSPAVKLHVVGATRITGQLNVMGDAETKRVWVDYEDGNDMGTIQVVQDGVAYKNLALQPDGNNVGIGTRSPGEKLEVNGVAKATRFTSTVATGTAPLTVDSTTVVTNLNADLLDGNHGSAYQLVSGMGSYALSNHTHGNISNGGGWQSSPSTISSGDSLVVTQSGLLRNTTLAFNSNTDAYLAQNGTWVKPTYTAYKSTKESNATTTASTYHTITLPHSGYYSITVYGMWSKTTTTNLVGNVISVITSDNTGTPKFDGAFEWQQTTTASSFATENNSINIPTSGTSLGITTQTATQSRTETYWSMKGFLYTGTTTDKTLSFQFACSTAPGTGDVALEKIAIVATKVG